MANFTSTSSTSRSGRAGSRKTATPRTPYLFSAKELDEETGLYYFGARYYDPRTSVWQSADPVLEKYLSANGHNSVYEPNTLSLYSYTHLNTLRLVDPDGRE